MFREQYQSAMQRSLPPPRNPYQPAQNTASVSTIGGLPNAFNRVSMMQTTLPVNTDKPRYNNSSLLYREGNCDASINNFYDPRPSSHMLPGPSHQTSSNSFNLNNKMDAALSRKDNYISTMNPTNYNNTTFKSQPVAQDIVIYKSNMPTNYSTQRSNYFTQAYSEAFNNNQENEKSSNLKRNETQNRLFTGTAERIIKWHKAYHNHLCYYEVIGAIVSIQEGTVRLQKIMLLRDRKGPIIQIVHYINDHIKIDNFFVGQMLRCVGHMVGPTTMHGLSIREATDSEVATLQRMCYISDHAIGKALTKP